MHEWVSAYAPSNIALVKYWGKRDKKNNLPVTGSLSVSLADRGAHTRVRVNPTLQRDQIAINSHVLTPDDRTYPPIVEFLNRIRPSKKTFFEIESESTIPIAAGLASSAAGFAALAQCVDALLKKKLSDSELSALARLGSGSAARSLWHGFVEWQRGDKNDGTDSVAVRLPHNWPELRVGLLIFTDKKKPMTSRAAMNHTVETSPLYRVWPDVVAADLVCMRAAIKAKNITELGEVAEANALAMHATMMAARPAVIYSTEQTLLAIRQVQRLRAEGAEVYFTQDAGPNLKLLFEASESEKIQQSFPGMQVVSPFSVEETQTLRASASDSAIHCLG